MAIATRCRIRAPGFKRKTVNARAVTFRLPLVTVTTIHRFCREVVVGMFLREVGMTTRTRVRLVRGREQLCRINEQGNLPAGGVCLRERFVRMTFETILIFQPCHRRELKRNPQRGPSQKPQTRDTHAALPSRKAKPKTPPDLPIVARFLRGIALTTSQVSCRRRRSAGPTGWVFVPVCAPNTCLPFWSESSASNDVPTI